MAKKGGKTKNVVTKEQKDQMSLTKKAQVQTPVPQMMITKNDGLSIQGAINLEGASDITLEVNKHLERLFNVPKEDRRINTDGDYFVISEQVVQSMKRDKKYKVVYVEDSKHIKHQVFFLLPQARLA